MDHAFRVRDWSELYETAESRKRVGGMEWLRMYTKHDSRGYKRVLRLKNGEKAYLGFLSMLQVAAKMPCRGLLATIGGPLDALDLEDKTGISEKTFRIAQEELVSDKIGWLEQIEWDPKLDFDANLARHGMQRSGPADDRQAAAGSGRRRQAPPGKQDQKNGQNVPREAADDGIAPARTGTHRQPAADSGRSQQGSAEGGTDKREEEAKQLLHDLFGREKRHWSHEEMTLLGDATPFPRKLWPLIHTWFTLAKENPEHPLWQVTKAKQELTTFLRDFHGEIDKMQRHSSLFTAADLEQKKDPDHWREVARWLWGEEVRLPADFEDLDRDQREDVLRNVAAWQQGGAKK
jgi:hypothetical protein